MWSFFLQQDEPVSHGLPIAINMDIAPQLYQYQKKLPKTSGVYLFLDERKYPLYIGKSVNLRSRVASYLRNAKAQEERIQRMVHEARSLKFVETETELMALLLEDSLIKKYLPVYNIRQKQFRDYRYLQLSDDTYPRLITLEDPGKIQKHIYGPFRDRFFIQRLQEIFSRYLGFRSCAEANPIKSCIELDIGQCLGPCVLMEVQEAYAMASEQVAHFLEGEDPGVISKIEEEIRICIKDTRFEHAQRLRDDLIFCDAFFNRQRFNHRFRVEHLKIEAREEGSPGYLFENGALKEVVLRDGRLCKVGEQLDLFDLSIVKEDEPRFLLDRANLVYNWLKKNQSVVRYEFQD
ncbi:MAG: GIY-YIG nuclease family protein [Candidatus Marinimicrobia bacterium]|nr:GIY-YIG nuclease family protein [Candidatus Neomarinimicrobiota bacterium]